MQHIKRCSGPLRSQKGLSLFLGRKLLKGVSDVGLAVFLTSMVAQRSVLCNSVTRDLNMTVKVIYVLMLTKLLKSDFLRHFTANANRLTKMRSNFGIMVSECYAACIPATYGGQPNGEYLTSLRGRFLQLLAGLGVAAAATYAVFKELIFEPKEYKIFNKALKRIQDDSQESRNRAARQRIPNRIFTDEDDKFLYSRAHGAGKVSAEMFKDKVDKQWKYTYLIVEIMQPSRSQLILESYMPAPAPVST
ncbi:hypothetical protein SADUNF_Sadunf02G0118500 [Salix dunnii]|uniref:Mitochondrial import inner membrane translocase subunit Tim21 n=1 Tax=Salix dunnii TaxID=1413687 RepID=A0A835N7E5_9ROSI|nr:hypothetical protein SADUNF_Sadunf02G0118500 [Salix dunnii]